MSPLPRSLAKWAALRSRSLYIDHPTPPWGTLAVVSQNHPNPPWGTLSVACQNHPTPPWGKLCGGCGIGPSSKAAVVSLASVSGEVGRVAVTLAFREPPDPALGDVSSGLPELPNPAMGEAFAVVVAAALRQTEGRRASVTPESRGRLGRSNW